MVKHITFALILLSALYIVTSWKIFPLENVEATKAVETVKGVSPYKTYNATTAPAIGISKATPTTTPKLKTHVEPTESTSRFSFKQVSGSVSFDNKRNLSSKDVKSTSVSTINRLSANKPSRDLLPPKEDTSETSSNKI
ncbi:uncharacterized protein LOC116413538 [Galleria mellonella]|uniref:Uncharacterized protein LOC116413538 n=1 Tax=Galleria mellonella TaxID=7137 RepID=A0A6J3C9Y5_GALME|nr:uncharacterized protein LOC116413538 [Galleria mellonella]